MAADTEGKLQNFLDKLVKESKKKGLSNCMVISMRKSLTCKQQIGDQTCTEV